MSNARRAEMRILHVTNMWPTESRPYIGAYLPPLYRRLSELHGEHSVFMIPPRCGALGYAKVLPKLRGEISCCKYNIVHAQYAYSAVLCAFIKRNIPLVSSFHGEFDFRANEVSDGHERRNFSNIRESMAAKFADRYSTASTVVNRHDLRYLSAKIRRCIPIGIDLEMFHPMPRAEACMHLGWDPRRKYILFPASTTRRQKNYPLFSSVCTHLKKCLCELEEVILDGYEYEIVPYILNAVDLMLLPSHTEASPTVVKEALACNLPIVSTPVGDVSDRIAGVEACYIAQPNVKSIVPKALDVLKSSRRSDGFSKKRREISIAYTAHEYMRLYRRILENQAGGIES